MPNPICKVTEAPEPSPHNLQVREVAKTKPPKTVIAKAERDAATRAEMRELLRSARRV